MSQPGVSRHLKCYRATYRRAIHDVTFRGHGETSREWADQTGVRAGDLCPVSGRAPPGEAADLGRVLCRDQAAPEARHSAAHRSDPGGATTAADPRLAIWTGDHRRVADDLGSGGGPAGRPAPGPADAAACPGA